MPLFRSTDQVRYIECEAYKKQVKCMRDRLNSCKDKACRDRVEKYLQDTIDYAKKEHGCTNL